MACTSVLQQQGQPQQSRQWGPAGPKCGAPSSGSASSGRDVGPCGYRALTGPGAGTTCWSLDHSATRCYRCLDDLHRERFGPHAITPHWPSCLRQRTAALVESHLPSIGPFPAAREETCVSSLGVCVVSSLEASEGLCVGAVATTSLAPAFVAGSGATSQTAPLSLTLDSGAFSYFFRDCTDLTPLRILITVALADPSVGPVVAHSTTTLPCPAAPSGFLTGYYTPSFSRSLERFFLIVVDEFSRFTTVFPLRRKADVPTVLEPWLLARGGAQGLCGLHLHLDRGGEFSSTCVEMFCQGQGIILSYKLPASPQQNGVAEQCISLSMEVARTSMLPRYNSRLVAKGFHQTKGKDFDEIFAHVGKGTTLRVSLAAAANCGWRIKQMDITTAFLNGIIMEELYMQLPEGLDDGSGMVCRLKKAIYGLKQAPRAWYHKLEETLLTGGFKKSECDHSLFLLQEKNDPACVAASAWSSVTPTTSMGAMARAASTSRSRRCASITTS
ncbi:unnamed protein product [Closterium sp. NIES-54]